MDISETILILDLGSHTLKLAAAQINQAQLKIKKLIVIPLPEDLRNNFSLSSSALTEFINKILIKNNLSYLKTLICLSSARLEIKQLLLPAMDEKQLDSSIRWQAKDIFATDPENAVIDYSIQGTINTAEGEKTAVEIASLPKTIINEYITLLQNLKLNPGGFFVESQSAWAELKDTADLQNKKTVILINLGNEKTIVSVYHNAKLQLTRTTDFSGSRLTAEIASRTPTADEKELPWEEAEAIKCKYGISAASNVAATGITAPDIFAALRPTLEDFTIELSHIIEYYKNEHGEENIDAVILYGGTSQLPGLANYLEKNIGCSVTMPDLSSLKTCLIPETEKEIIAKQGPFLVNTIGTALLKNDAINLLPVEIKEQKQLKIDKKQWSKIWIVTAVCLFCGYLLLISVNGWRKAKLNKLNNKYKEMSSWQSSLSAYNQTIVQLNDKMILACDLIQQQPFWEDIFKELAGLIPNNIILDKLMLEPEDEEGNVEKETILTIAGFVTKEDKQQQETLTRLMHNLEKSSYFHKIDLEFSNKKSAEEDTKKDEKILEFNIKCNVNQLNL